MPPKIIRSRSSNGNGSDGEILYAQLINFCNSTKFAMFDVKGVDIKIEIPVPEDFNTIKDRYNLILNGMLPMPALSAYEPFVDAYRITVKRFLVATV